MIRTTFGDRGNEEEGGAVPVRAEAMMRSGIPIGRALPITEDFTCVLLQEWRIDSWFIERRLGDRFAGVLRATVQE